MKQKVILYGTDIVSDAYYAKICEKYEPVCFISHLDSPGRDEFHGLPVLPLKDAVEAYPDSQILMTMSNYIKHEAIDWILQHNVPSMRIMKFQGKVEERWGCPYTGEFALFWNGEMRHCCSLATTYHLSILTAYGETGAESYQAATANTNKLIELLQDDSFREKYCGTCPLLRHGKWVIGKTLDKIVLSIESNCNYKCIYCGDGGGPYGGRTLDDGTSMSHALDMLEYCKENDILDEFAYFFISCGEPALHPRIKDICNFVSDYRCTFATNASVYSEPIASVLRKGLSKLRVSIDAGTPETYAKVRGVPGKFFGQVHDNLEKYAQIGKQYIELQYIVMPEKNVDVANIDGFCEFARGICGGVLINHDRVNYVEYDTDTLLALKRLRRQLEEAGIPARIYREGMDAFTEDEIKLLEAP